MDDLPEFAFIGRSNVGKSSLINMIAGRKGLARISQTPGKTRHINHFRVDCTLRDHLHQSWFLVDLPGYGYARLPKDERDQIDAMIRNYLMKRESLAITFLLIDANIEPQTIDLDFIDWLSDNDLPFIILFTKTDKPNQKDLGDHIQAFSDELKKSWSELPMMIMTSARQNNGRDEVLASIEKALLEIV